MSPEYRTARDGWMEAFHAGKDKGGSFAAHFIHRAPACFYLCNVCPSTLRVGVALMTLMEAVVSALPPTLSSSLFFFFFYIPWFCASFSAEPLILPSLQTSLSKAHLSPRNPSGKLQWSWGPSVEGGGDGGGGGLGVFNRAGERKLQPTC